MLAKLFMVIGTSQLWSYPTSCVFCFVLAVFISFQSSGGWGKMELELHHNSAYFYSMCVKRNSILFAFERY